MRKPDCYFETVINREGCSGYQDTILGRAECDKCFFYVGEEHENKEIESNRYPSKSEEGSMGTR